MAVSAGSGRICIRSHTTITLSLYTLISSHLSCCVSFFCYCVCCFSLCCLCYWYLHLISNPPPPPISFLCACGFSLLSLLLHVQVMLFRSVGAPRRATELLNVWNGEKNQNQIKTNVTVREDRALCMRGARRKIKTGENENENQNSDRGQAGVELRVSSQQQEIKTGEAKKEKPEKKNNAQSSNQSNQTFGGIKTKIKTKRKHARNPTTDRHAREKSKQEEMGVVVYVCVFWWRLGNGATYYDGLCEMEKRHGRQGRGTERIAK